MNAFLRLDGIELWYVAGWTMLHFLWLGALAGIVAGACRVVLRRAPANVRYVAALGCLALLAALPIGVAAWMVAKPQVEDPPGRAEIVAASSSSILTTDASPPSEVAAFVDTNPQQDRPPTVVVPTLTARPPLADFALDLSVRYLPWLWLVGTPLTFLLLVTGIVGAERLRRASRVLDDGPIADACARLVHSLAIGRRVTVAVCERIAAPVLVGIVRPIILLPPAALTGWSPDEIEMVLLHELAHVRRWDNLVNLMQRLVESLLFFHPAVWLVSAWVRREREACCDAAVVGRTYRPHAYATLLVTLAASLSEPGRPRHRSDAFTRGRGRPGSLVASAMAAGPLHGRIRRILELEDDPMLVSGKSLGIVMSGFLLAATLVVLNLPTRGNAEESTTEVTEGTKKDVPASRQAKETVRDSAAPLSTIGDWPARIVFPSPKEGEISRRAWLELGIKVVPANRAEETAPGGRPLKVVGGVSMPPYPLEAKGPIFLMSVDKNVTRDFDDLASALEKVKDKELKVVECVVTTERGPVWTAIAAGPPGVPQKTVPVEPTSSKRSPTFPSLEEQKLADLAWKRMGLELEPIGEEDLLRVKALGYDGGLKVAGPSPNDIHPNDILVGLHVWPTTSLKDVADVLNRDDLAELNPLKFYVIRRVPTGGGGRGGYGGRSDSNETRDEVVTGRIIVNAPVRQVTYTTAVAVPPIRKAIPGEAAPLIAAYTPTPVVPAPYSVAATDDKPILRYDGKTFDEWKGVLRTELSTEKRLEATRAMAAFGASGHGIEAAQALLAVAGQIDWSRWKYDDKPETDSVKLLRATIIDAFNGQYFGRLVPLQIPREESLPVLLANLDSPNLQTRQFVAKVLDGWSYDPRVAQSLVQLSRDDDPSVRSSAFQTMGWGWLQERKEVSGPIVERIREALRSDDRDLQVLALQAMIADASWDREPPQLRSVPELESALFSDDETARRHARQAISMAGPEDATRLTAQLQDDLHNKPEARKQQLDGIRALAALGPKAEPAVPQLKVILTHPDASYRVAAAAAIKMILGKDQYQKPIADVLGEELGITVVESNGVWGALPREDAKDGGKAFGDFTEAVIKEQQQLFPDGKF